MLLPLSPTTHLSFHSIGRGAPILFLHAFPFTSLMYAHAARNLPPGFRAILPDLRGFGESTPITPTTPTTPITIRDFALDALRILDALNIHEPAIIVGTSLGGMIALELWRTAPHRIAGLILSNTRANAENAQGRQRRENLARLTLAKGSAAYVDTVIGQIFSPALDHALLQRWAAIMAAQSPTTIAATACALAHRPDATPTLPTITCPTLVIGSELDSITPPDSLRQLHAAITHTKARATLKILPAVGHIPSIEAPDDFSSCVNDFVKSIHTS